MHLHERSIKWQILKEFITKEKLVIEYYIKNDLVFPLGTFLCIIVKFHIHLLQDI